MTSDLDQATYISFGSFKRDGNLIATPTWVTPYEDGYAFTTDASSFKVARVRSNPSVVIRVCDIRGRVTTDALVHHGTAKVLTPAQALEVRDLIKAKYRLGWLLTIAPRNLFDKIRGRAVTLGECALKISIID